MSIAERSLEVVGSTLARGLVESGRIYGASEEHVASVIVRVLREDRATELAIDDEARRLMQKHSAEIARGNMDTGELLRKFKAQIAKEKGFSL